MMELSFTILLLRAKKNDEGKLYGKRRNYIDSHARFIKVKARNVIRYVSIIVEALLLMSVKYNKHVTGNLQVIHIVMFNIPGRMRYSLENWHLLCSLMFPIAG